MTCLEEPSRLMCTVRAMAVVNRMQWQGHSLQAGHKAQQNPAE